MNETHDIMDSDPILPSSQPQNEPSLPDTPTAVHGSVPPARKLKRPFEYRSRVDGDALASAFGTSSDPAIFSSDEAPEAADSENYSPGAKRRKKKYAGAWWGRLRKTATHVSGEADGETSTTDIVRSQRAKRSFRRNYDSGIFMGDDSSGTDLSSDPPSFSEETSTSATVSRQATPEDKITPSYLHHHDFERMLSPPRKTIQRTSGIHTTPKQRDYDPRNQSVRNVVRACLRENKEDVDWSGLDLTNLPSEITELKTLIRRTADDLDGFEPFVPRLRIYLSNNQLARVPPSLLELDRTYLLSLRQNQLNFLPSDISKLRAMRELNIAANRLQTLPYELLLMLRDGKLKRLHSEPNPWLPQPLAEDQLDLSLLKLETDREDGGHNRADNFPHCVCVSLAHEVRPNGMTFRPQPSTTLPRLAAATSSPSNTAVPFLSEVCLRKLSRYKFRTAEWLSDPSNRELLSDPVLDMLQTLQEVQAGGRHCTFCTRPIILPRHTWVEWWRLSAEQVIPFERMACGCQGQVEGLIAEMQQAPSHAPGEVHA